MSAVRSKDTVIGIVCADLHLSSCAPVARAGEKDWFEAMRRPLKELAQLSKQHGDPPVICAGDIFDLWRSSPELINFALEHLPSLQAIPGQHDLPYHSLEELHKSAFWTLCRAGKINPVWNCPDGYQVGPLLLCGFAFGQEIKPPPDQRGRGLMTVALVHRYMWIGDCCYSGAPQDSHLAAFRKSLSGYDVVVVGDNHKSWEDVVGKRNTVVFNCGGFMRRKSDEIDHRPRVGLLMSSGMITSHYLDISHDCIEATAEDRSVPAIDVGVLFDELRGLPVEAPDFVQTICRVMDERKVRPTVRRVVMEAIENGRR